MEHISKADMLYVDEDFDGAISEYTKVIQSSEIETAVLGLAHSHRAAALLRQRQFATALEDSNKAIKIGINTDIVHYRKG